MRALANYRPSLTTQVFVGLPLTIYAAYQADKYSELAATIILNTFYLFTAERLLQTGHIHFQERGAWNKVKGAVQCLLGATWMAEPVIEIGQRAGLLPSDSQLLQNVIGSLDQKISKLQTLTDCIQSHRDSMFYQDNICISGMRNLAKMETKFGQQEEQVMVSCSTDGVSNSTIPTRKESMSALRKGLAKCVQEFDSYSTVVVVEKPRSLNDLEPQVNASFAR